ncbi:protein MAINTENANCE OF MERISTEMS-like [Hibiscus syriacus]|uniref:protein MAINTENANCE OF MERISTEMS-like n=1 Tax=Hibiscus syriacus TaxID=106335 RepID=UPI00192322D8|nr:protein MAINTENANCE OF MERISTEMS-like [Hibiscus syriacus]
MTNEEPHQRIMIYLQKFGLYPSTFLRDFKVMTTLISTLIERWRPETHTFHFPSGEVTITLKDVYQFGVSINGIPLVLRNNYAQYAFIYNLLGNEALTDVIDEMRIRMTWLEREFRVYGQSTEQEVKYAARAYLMALIGGILLLDKSDNLMHPQYLSILKDFLVCLQYSLGSAILTFCIVNFTKTTIVVSGKKRM